MPLPSFVNHNTYQPAAVAAAQYVFISASSGCRCLIDIHISQLRLPLSNTYSYQPAAKILRISSLLEIPPMSILPDKKLSVQAPTLLTVSIAADMNCYTILHMFMESS